MEGSSADHPIAREPLVRARIRRLPLNTSDELLRLIVSSDELADAELLPPDRSLDDGFRSAVLWFTTMDGALRAKNRLDGQTDANMMVEIMSSNPTDATDPSSSNLLTTLVPPPAARESRFTRILEDQPRFSKHYEALQREQERNPPPQKYNSINPYETVQRRNAAFSAPAPNALSSTLGQPRDRTPVSGKAIIENNLTDDDETTDLLKDPVAYAENGPASRRRQTDPQIPFAQMAGLSLNTTSAPVSASVPSPYEHPMSAVAYGYGPSKSHPHHSHRGNWTPRNLPAVNLADQNPPCNTLYVGNLPLNTSEDELKAMFVKQRGYKRLCFRTKGASPMCFVEFEDVSFATKALHDLYGSPLHNSVKGGIRLSFSKNPLGVRSQQAHGPAHNGAMGGMNGTAGAANGFTTANGPPPGLALPPGLAHAGQSRVNYNPGTPNGNHHMYNQTAGFPGGSNYPWNSAPHNHGISNGPNSPPNGAAGVNGNGTGSYGVPNMSNGLGGPNAVNDINGHAMSNGYNSHNGYAVPNSAHAANGANGYYKTGNAALAANAANGSGTGSGGYSNNGPGSLHPRMMGL